MKSTPGIAVCCQLVILLCCSSLAMGAGRPLESEGGILKEDKGVTSDDAPWFCHDLECPKYTLEASYQGGTIELRSYEPSVWASTNVSDVGYDAAVRTGFFRLFRYISGANEDDEKIEMTAPVKVRAVPGEGPFCESHFVISFMVPFDLQDAPPEPTADNVYIEKMDATKFWVSSYGGWNDETKLVKHASDLLSDLDALGLEYEDSYFYSAGYDSPFRLLNRHNEVWVEAVEGSRK